MDTEAAGSTGANVSQETKPQFRFRTRAWGAVVFLAAAGVLGLAAWLRPDPRGFGTHEQLGAAPCGWLVVSGLPCPTCGMTTAFAHAVRGQWIRAFLAQPAGFVMALATGAAAVGGLWVTVTARPIYPAWRWVTPYRLFFAFLVLLVAGWAFKLLFMILAGTAHVSPGVVWRTGG